MKYSSKLTIAIILVVFIFQANPAGIRVSAQTGLNITAAAGIDGYCKANRWLPVQITIENTGENIEGKLLAKVNENDTTWEFGNNISIPSVSRKELTIYVRPPGDRINEVEVSLISGNNILYSETVRVNCVSQSDVLLGVWAQNPSLFNPQVEITTPGNRATILVLNERTLPNRAEGLEMLDALTISGVDAGKLNSAQREAISTWISKGGKLLLTGGPAWLETSSGWTFELPLSPESTTTVTNLDQIQNLVPGTAPLDGQTVVTTGRKSQRAVILAGDADLPFILYSEQGFGYIYYFALDPTLEPLRTWSGMGELYEALIGSPSEKPPWTNGFQEWESATEALNTIEGLGMPPFLLICGFITIYIALAGPINFFLLRRLKKRDFAWITVPMIVILFTGLILLVSSTLLGNRPILNRLNLVQVWPGEKNASVHGLVGVFSPRRETFSLDMSDGFLASPIPPRGFGADGWDHRILQRDNGFEIPSFRVDVGGLQGVFITGEIPSPEINANFQIEVSSTGSPVLSGTFTNNSDFTLKDVVLLSGALPSELGDIQPGEQIRASAPFAGSHASSNSYSSNVGYTPYGVDNTLIDLFGTNFMYPSNSVGVETYRRFKLMSAALGGSYGSRGTGTYLIGWGNESPYDINLSANNSGGSDTTAFIFHITPSYVYSIQPGDELTLPPGMFSWSVFDTPVGDVTASPYAGYLNEGEFSIRYLPLADVQFSSVKRLSLHLSSYGAGGSADLEISLWDFKEGRWSRIPQLDWGDTDLPAPQRFVGTDGEIRMQLKNTTNFGISVEQADFTLVVER